MGAVTGMKFLSLPHLTRILVIWQVKTAANSTIPGSVYKIFLTTEPLCPGNLKALDMNNNKKKLSPEQQKELINKLKSRFEKNRNRHKGLDWDKIEARLEKHPDKLWSLSEMERTDGEPDVVGQDKKTGEFIFYDCSAESPKGRRSVCYDREGLESRKEFKPENNAMDMAAAMGIELLTEEEYRELQKLGSFDAKTSSWLKTPHAIRKLGGALFGDFRYGNVFVYHNGAPSYYAARGFRGSLRV